MNIIQKFEGVSAIRSLSKPSFLEVDKPYPKISAMKRSHLTLEVVVFALRVNDESVIFSCCQ
jgi:hypothetical protein